VQLRRRQLVADIDGHGGYVTLYVKHGGRTIRVGRRAWDALQFLADGKEPDERIIAMTDERIRQILTAAAEAAGLKKKLSPHWLHPCARLTRASAKRAGGDPFAIRSVTHRRARPTSTSAQRRRTGSSLYLQF
jgi:hypothetical protein